MPEYFIMNLLFKTDILRFLNQNIKYIWLHWNSNWTTCWLEQTVLNRNDALRWNMELKAREEGRCLPVVKVLVTFFSCYKAAVSKLKHYWTMSLRVQKYSSSWWAAAPTCLNVAAAELNSEQHVNHKTARRRRASAPTLRAEEDIRDKHLNKTQYELISWPSPVRPPLTRAYLCSDWGPVTSDPEQKHVTDFRVYRPFKHGWTECRGRRALEKSFLVFIHHTFRKWTTLYKCPPFGTETPARTHRPRSDATSAAPPPPMQWRTLSYRTGVDLVGVRQQRPGRLRSLCLRENLFRGRCGAGRQ